MTDDDNGQAGGETLHDLRAMIFATIRGVRDNAVPLDKARTMNELFKTAVDTGRLEVEHKRADPDAERSKFIDGGDEAPQTTALPNGITGIVRHRLGG